MAKQKILITGVNGFIGHHLAKRINLDKFEVFAIGKSPLNTSLSSYITKYFELDLTKSISIDEDFECVIHLAALNVTNVQKAEYEAYVKANVLVTKNLIDHVSSNRFLLMSTAKVYKKQEGILDETSPVEPINGYERSKLEAENILRESKFSKHCVILRSTNVVGPGQAQKAVIPIFIKNALVGEPIDIFAPRDSMLHLLYIDDLIDALNLILEKKEFSGLYNIGGKEAISLENLICSILRLTNSKSQVSFSNDQKTMFINFSVGKIEQVLGWSPKMKVNDILKLCIKSLE